jgi:hypothetical protein
MKNVVIGTREKEEIQKQIDKILHGLGNPGPPLDLREVRELLRLDRQYYNSRDHSALQEFVSKVRVGAKQLFLRPTLLLDVVRKADLSALWVPDRKRILIDSSTPRIKHRWYEAHEVTHSVTEWHQMFLFGDSRKELNPACHEILEAEANYGAGQLLFLRDRFTREAMDTGISIESIRDLSKSFGNTITSTLWRYVEEVGRETPMIALVSGHPLHEASGFDPAQPCKYCVESGAFKRQFANVSEVDLYKCLRSYCSYGTRGPLGQGEIDLLDVNGDKHRFCFETFSNTYECLTLGVYSAPVLTVVSVL